MTDNANMVNIIGFHSLLFKVSNAKIAASYFVTRFGFHDHYVHSLETGERNIARHAVKNGNILFIFESFLNDLTINDRYARHDHVSCINLKIDDSTEITKIRAYGNVFFQFIDPYTCSKDQKFQSTTTYKNSIEILSSITMYDNSIDTLPSTRLLEIDHVVGNQKDGEMENVCEYFERVFNMHRFWSVDENQIHTEYSALRSVVMASENEKVLLPINEPAPGKKKSQIQEFIDYNNGPGVQHIAFLTDNILESVTALRKRGVKFLAIPNSYYDNLIERLEKSPSVKINESMEMLKTLQILVDFDGETGDYMLQIFTESMDYRPTIFFEIIQRNGHKGFGAGNFKALFEALESEQDKRGNLSDFVRL